MTEEWSYYGLKEGLKQKLLALKNLSILLFIL